MVRVGGGWDTLERYLDKHDPCRCPSSGGCPQRAAGGGPSLRLRASRAARPLSPQPTAHRSRGPAPSPHRGCHPPPALARAAQSRGVSAGAPGPR